MDALTWLLTFAALGTWLVVGLGLLLRPLAAPSAWGALGRRLLWLGVWAAALLGGSWGPDLWSRTAVDYPNDPSLGAVVERTTAMLRTPVAVRTWNRDLDGAARVVRAEERLALQLPVALLVFFGVVYFSRVRERGGRDRGSRARPETRSSALALLVLLLPLAACQLEREGAEASRPDRVITQTAWDTLLYLRVEPEDTLLYSANHMVAGERGFWVLDRVGYRVAHFDWDGNLRWYAGRQGAGPGEFLNPRMLQLDDRQRVWVLDVGTHRITGFDPQGTLVRELSLEPVDGVLHAFAADATGEQFFGMFATDALRPVSIGLDGRVRRGQPIRIADAEESFGMALQGTATGAADGEGWIYAFTMGDGLFRMRGVDLVGSRVRYPEWIPFPGVDRREETTGEVTTTATRLTEPNFSATEVAVAGGRIFVRFHGESDRARLLLDIYDYGSGEYLETVLLPRRGRLSAWADRILLAWDDPAPEIAVVRRR